MKRLLLALLATACLSAPVPAPASAQVAGDNTEDTLAALQTFAEAFALVRENYVEDTEDPDLIGAALNGALSHLDPHSGYVPPAKFEEGQKRTRREYGGLGIEISQRDGLVYVNYAIEDGPAARAGITTGDYITHVEGESVLGKDLDAAVEGMRGEAGDSVNITVLTGDGPARRIDIVREVVRGRPVRHRMEKGIPYVFIETFNNPKLSDDLEAALTDLKGRAGGNMDGLIIDMRGNRGGLLDQSIDVSSMFLDGGEVLSARGRDNADNERYHAESGELYPGMPIVVLINSGSASAAEIVAGALQDRGRAVVMGRRSFGKGSVQSVTQLPPYGVAGALRLTTQRYYTPSGKSIQGRGILPDVLVAALDQPDDGEIRDRTREDSLPYALTNLDGESDYKEIYEQIQYPPEGWPDDQDYQLHRAVQMIQSPSRYRSVLSTQDSKGRVSLP